MITAIIPAYNEEKTIGSVVLGTQQHVSRVIVVDDVEVYLKVYQIFS